MAFRRIEVFEKYTCLSTDVKTTVGIANDSTCLETNTGDLYTFDGADWRLTNQNVSLTDYEAIDVDTGAGTVNALPITWRKSGAGGPEFGTSINPVRTDTTGSTTQPVSNANLDIALSALRDAITGTDAAARTQGQIEAAVLALRTASTLDTLETVITAIKDTDGIKKITDAVTVGSSVLPTGAATEATLVAIGLLLTSLDGKDYATQATLANILTQLNTTGLKKIIDALPAGDNNIGNVDVVTLPAIPAGTNNIGDVDVVSSVLPTGAAVAAKQDALIAKDFATEATLASVQATLAQGGIPATTLETTHQNAATTDGNGTAAAVSGYGPIAFQVTGTFDTATVTYKGSVDGTNYEALPGTSAVTAVGISKFDVSGYKSVLAVISGAGASTSLTIKSLAVGVARPLTADVITVGKAADNAAANGNPVLFAGKYNTTPATRDEGDVVTLQTDAQGNLLTKLTGSNVEQILNQNLPTKANLIGISDGTKIQAMQGNTEGVLLTSVARTTSISSPNQVNYNARGAMLSLNISANPGNTETLQVSVDAIDPVSGGTRAIVTFPLVNASNARYFYYVYPGIIETLDASGVSVQALPLPKQWKAAVTHSSTSSWTYSLSYSYII